ncbi:hypothetical protein AVEN_14183-1 [Araneus ventricosus]|uniref:Secreted protein n=1 Tax=Araneus ventricosus TaxID=182803 RepID=A0A4Y2KCI5_ARAVE|nr:hypothetical protein AVEN_14183-1 [Araneus ventricosus]
MQQFLMRSAFLLLRQKIVALLWPPPPLTNSLPQLLAVKHNEVPLGLRWSAIAFALLRALRYHSYTHPVSRPCPKTQSD